MYGEPEIGRVRRGVLAGLGYSVREDKLRDYRLRRRMTQQQLAAKSELSVTQVSRIEQGVHVPRFSSIERLAQALDVPPEELVREDGQEAEAEPEPRSTRYLVETVAAADGAAGVEAYARDVQRLLNEGDGRGSRLVHIGEIGLRDAAIVVWDTAPYND